MGNIKGSLIMKQYIFISGIRKIVILANSLKEASLKLTHFESDAWTDPSWNWKVSISR